MEIGEAVRAAREHLARREFEPCRQLCNSILQAVPRHPEAIEMFRALPPAQTYGEAFYQRQAETSYASALALLGFLFDAYRPRSMVDFGAGVGTWLRAARELGVERTLGIEGEWVRPHVEAGGIAYRFQNLNQRVRLDERFDLALSVEVAEHLLPERAESLVEDIAAASDLVVFGAAMPHQGGDGHLNERMPSYWIRLFRRAGFDCLDLFRPAFWFQPNVEPWYVQNTFVFLRSGDARSGLFPRETLYDVYHPALVNSYIQARFNGDWSDEL